MKILEVYLECGGYDYQLIKGGISVYTWNLSQALQRQGHDAAILTAMHGQQEYLAQQHGLTELDYRHEWTMNIDADPAIWGEQQPIAFPLVTKAYLLEKNGTQIYILSNQILDRYPDSYYPPYDSKGKDTGFFKPLVFQAEVIHFVRNWFAAQNWIIHAHEPFYQYLIPAAFKDDSTKQVVSTVQSNMPINKKVYLPEVESLFEQLHIQLDLSQFADEVQNTPFNQCLVDYLPVTHLNYPYPENYINLFSLCVTLSDKVDFLSQGHLEFYSQFRGTAFRALYLQLNIAKLVAQHQNKLFVGGCAISPSWLQQDYATFDREHTLESMGMDPSLPTFYHNARYAPNHKGQVELIQAISAFLQRGIQANFILRCVSGTGIPDERFHQLTATFPQNVVLKWQMEDEAELMAMAAASDFALFPSKFEMDTFLIAIGEAMLAGCVPIASEQLGMKHWWHSSVFSGENPPTGFSVIRSFKEEDPQLVDSLTLAFNQALELYSHPDKFKQLSRWARQHALSFSWDNVAIQHINAFKTLDKAPPNKAASMPYDENDWLSCALHHGELMSVREHAQLPDMPMLKISSHSIDYRCSNAVSVTAFLEQEEQYTQFELDEFESGHFMLEQPAQHQRFFLLVTIHGGDQFWDGVTRGDL